jgi:two-component system, OmpR family, response regulator MprA
MARILIVDDDKAIRRATRTILNDAGHEVAEESNGLLIEETVAAWRPDVLIVDIIMPYRGGIETIAALRRSGVRTPIIAVTGVNARSLASAGRLGADATLEKPFEAQTLLALIESVLRPRSGRR